MQNINFFIIKEGRFVYVETKAVQNVTNTKINKRINYGEQDNVENDILHSDELARIMLSQNPTK